MTIAKSVEELREGLQDPSRHVSKKGARLYVKSIERGVCVSCRKVPPIPGRRRCSRCAGKYAGGSADPVRRRPYYRRWKEQKLRMGLCTACGKNPSRQGFKLCAPCNDYRKEKRAPHLEYFNSLRRRRLAERKTRTFEAYGGSKCACCEETMPQCLSLDHKNNDGAAHRRELSKRTNMCGEAIYKWLEKHGYPPGFQVLCMNCQWGKKLNGGICPHEQDRMKAAAKAD